MKQAIALLTILTGLLWWGKSHAATTPAVPADSIRLSLLTCGPGEEIYSLFGHTALRYEHPARGIDAVFNYGMFSFDTPNFILRFCLGQTDYLLGVNEYRHFKAEYEWEGREVRQQELNLAQEEKERLAAQLIQNARPENRIYRYNFFYDNCATRPRDKVEEALQGRLQYADDMETRETGTTFRDMLHRYTEGHPWARFGMDLCMGSKADRPITRREMMFVPFLVETFFAQATVADSLGGTRPLVAAKEQIVTISEEAKKHHDKCITPLQASLLLFIIVAALSIYGLKRKKKLVWLDAILFAAAGVAGIIPTFLVLFSEHPAVSPNWLVAVFHPLHLLCLPWIILCAIKGKKCFYHSANFILLTLFILCWAIIPQHFPAAILPLALCLLTRSGIYGLTRRQNKEFGTPTQRRAAQTKQTFRKQQ